MVPFTKGQGEVMKMRRILNIVYTIGFGRSNTLYVGICKLTFLLRNFYYFK